MVRRRATAQPHRLPRGWDKRQGPRRCRNRKVHERSHTNRHRSSLCEQGIGERFSESRPTLQHSTESRDDIARTHRRSVLRQRRVLTDLVNPKGVNRRTGPTHPQTCRVHAWNPHQVESVTSCSTEDMLPKAQVRWFRSASDNGSGGHDTTTTHLRFCTSNQLTKATNSRLE